MSTAPEVVMYATTWCPFCERARTLLQRKSVPYREIKVDDEPQERETMIARSGGRRTVPQIFIGERHIGGFDELYALERDGGLDPLLQRN